MHPEEQGEQGKQGRWEQGEQGSIGIAGDGGRWGEMRRDGGDKTLRISPHLSASPGPLVPLSILSLSNGPIVSPPTAHPQGHPSAGRATCPILINLETK